MELRPGYQRTDVGAIPNDWDVSTLGTYGRTYGGLTGKLKLDFGRGSGFYVTFLDIMENVVIDGTRLESVNVGPGESQNTVHCGDVLFTGSSETAEEVAMCALVRVDRALLYLNSFSFGYRIDFTDDVDGLFLAYLMRSAVGRRAIASLAQGSTRYNVSKRALLQAQLPWPVINEQRAIAAALSDVDALLYGLDRLIAKKRDLKQAAMQQLLTGQTRLPGFDGEWAVKRLGEMIKRCFSGATPRRNRPEFYKGNIRWITSGELNYNVIADTAEHISSEAVAETNLTIIPAGTFLMAITGLEAEGTRGACALVGAPSTTNQSCMAVFPTEGLVSTYLFHYYVFRGKGLALQYCQGTKQQSYTARLVRQLPIAIPSSPAEQRAIAAVLSDMDAELAALEVRRDKTRDLKQAIMQELLTGNTRLIEPEAALA